MFLSGIFLICAGFGVLLNYFIYDFQNPLWLGFGALISVAGLVLTIVGAVVHRSNIEKQAAINSAKERKCFSCNISVSPELKYCPVCRKFLTTEERKNGKNNN